MVMWVLRVAVVTIAKVLHGNMATDEAQAIPGTQRHDKLAIRAMTALLRYLPEALRELFGHSSRW